MTKLLGKLWKLLENTFWQLLKNRIYQPPFYGIMDDDNVVDLRIGDLCKAVFGWKFVALTFV